MVAEVVLHLRGGDETHTPIAREPQFLEDDLSIVGRRVVDRGEAGGVALLADAAMNRIVRQISGYTHRSLLDERQTPLARKDQRRRIAVRGRVVREPLEIPAQ